MNDIITIITLFVCFQATFIIAYFLGKRSTSIGGLERTGGTLTIDKLKQLYKDATNPNIPTGAIPHKTAKDIEYQNLPEKKKEGLEAMKETLDADPAMQEHRRLVEQLRKSGETV